MNGSRIACMLVSTVVMSSALSGADRAAPRTTSQDLMRKKLESAHGLLEGLVVEDFAMIETHAAALENVSRATTWYKQESPEFLAHAASFRLATSYLLEQARKKDMEGVALGHVRVTLSCVECHKLVRSARTK